MLAKLYQNLRTNLAESSTQHRRLVNLTTFTACMHACQLFQPLMPQVDTTNCRITASRRADRKARIYTTSGTDSIRSLHNIRYEGCRRAQLALGRSPASQQRQLHAESSMATNGQRSRMFRRVKLLSPCRGFRCARSRHILMHACRSRRKPLDSGAAAKADPLIPSSPRPTRTNQRSALQALAHTRGATRHDCCTPLPQPPHNAIFRSSHNAIFPSSSTTPTPPMLRAGRRPTCRGGPQRGSAPRAARGVFASLRPLCEVIGAQAPSITPSTSPQSARPHRVA